MGAEMTKLVVYMVIILFVFSSFIHAVENPDYVWRTVFDLGDVDAEMLIDNKSDSEELFHWHDAFYFMVVTFTTVGYGDVYPARPLSRMLIVGIIAFSFVFIPWQSSTLLSAFLNQDSYSGAYKGSNHIILCLQEGFEPHRVMYFLDEMMQSSDESERVLLLCPSPPSPDLKILFSRFYPRIQYLNGSATVYQDLRRAKFSAARAVLILACPTLSSELDDKRVFLSCVALGTDIDVEKRVIAQCRKPKTKATLMSMVSTEPARERGESHGAYHNCAPCPPFPVAPHPSSLTPHPSTLHPPPYTLTFHPSPHIQPAMPRNPFSTTPHPSNLFRGSIQ